MTPFPRETLRPLTPYRPDRRPIAVDLSDNTNRWGAHPGALEVVRAAGAHELTRYPSVYGDGLREAVSRRFDVPLEAVSTGCGSDDLLDSAFRAAGDAGESVAFIPPTFSMVEIFARMNGLEPSPVSAEEACDPTALLEGGPALVYLCRPNNPTGEVAPRDWVERLVEAAGSGGPVILIDEAYADFSDDTFLREAVDFARTLVLRTFSKAYGLAGLRVGYAMGHPDVVREVEKARGPYKLSRLGESAALAAFEDIEGWVPRVVAEVRREREYLFEELDARGLSPLPSGANFLLLPLPKGDSQEATARLREGGVAVRPFPGLPGIGDAIRISIGPRAEIDQFLRTLDEVLA